MVNDFGVKHIGKEHTTHMKDTLNLYYDITEDCKGKKCLGIDLNWNYEKRTVNLSMKNYAQELLIKFNHTKPNKPCHSPHANKIPKCGAKVQCANTPDESPELNK